MKNNYMSRNPELKAYIINCMVMRFSEKESLAYLKGYGYDIAPRTLYTIKKKIKGNRYQRIRDIFDFELVDQHLHAIDVLNTTVREMWINYHKEEDPYKKVDILTQIINVQPYLSDYYYGTHKVVEKVKPKQEDQNKEIETTNPTKPQDESV